DDVRTLSEWATDSLWPNRTYLLDMQPEDAFKRLHREQDRMESAGIDFARRTREAFLDLAQESADRYRVLDATFSAKSLSELIVQDVHNLIEEIETK
ncbi:dTMP kinase, partial [Gardnerella vaginalis]|uniref:dTMP kinase n=2 Tax=Bifidobacteriaceae TaxID=31953 RepID=UPI0039F090B6